MLRKQENRKSEQEEVI